MKEIIESTTIIVNGVVKYVSDIPLFCSFREENSFGLTKGSKHLTKITDF